jgi:mRNA interferase RelE/StbE
MSKIYEIVFKRSVLKDIRRIPKVVLQRIQEKITALKQEPIPAGAEPIEGYEKHFRIRIGQYRVVYEVAHEIRIITVIRIGHRKDVYRQL